MNRPLSRRAIFLVVTLAVLIAGAIVVALPQFMPPRKLTRARSANSSEPLKDIGRLLTSYAQSHGAFPDSLQAIATADFDPSVFFDENTQRNTPLLHVPGRTFRENNKILLATEPIESGNVRLVLLVDGYFCRMADEDFRRTLKKDASR